MKPLDTIINFSYLIMFIAISTIIGHYSLLGDPSYVYKWQAAAFGIVVVSSILVGIHLIYKLVITTHKD